MLDFQANILGVTLERPECIETTALGAAYLCGLALGVYASVEEIKANNGIEKTVQPTESNEWREAKVKTWRRAVERSLGWVE
jgi:glycerol kinase